MTNKEKILEHLQKYGSITQLEAINLYWFWRLSAVIYNLKKEGYNITAKTIKVKRADGTNAYVSQYILEDNPNERKQEN